MSSEPQVRFYEGRCHCGAIRFRFRSEEITEARRCNCSICVRKGAVVSARYYEPDEFELLQGRDDLSIYLWGDKMVNHYFCRHCGIYPFHRKRVSPDSLGINVFCLHDFEPTGIPVRQAVGAAMP